MARILANDVQIAIYIVKKFIENFKFKDFDFKYNR